MQIQIRGFYYNSERSDFSISLSNDNYTFWGFRSVTESEMWQAITYFVEHPHYMVTHYDVRVENISLPLRAVMELDCIYAPTLKAKQIIELNQFFERGNQL